MPTIGIPKELALGERRVAATPETIGRLSKAGYEVVVERGAGEQAFIPDERFESAGAHVDSREKALSADLVLTVALEAEAINGLQPGGVLVGFLQPLDRPELAQALAAHGSTALAMELVPRTSRAQKMDALSAMSNIAGYKAVLLAAETLPKFFPLLTTAAGTVRPAQVLVLGAGVAGLQALATARRLGAVTAAYDIRPAAREQVESVGAAFVELSLDTANAEDRGGYAKALAKDDQARQVEELAQHIAKADVVISTALIPGRQAPVLITERGVGGMKPGSVIVDLAAANGGNCALTQCDQDVQYGGVQILGPANLPATMPLHASELYARTVMALVLEFTHEGGFQLDVDDEIVQGACITRDGAIVNERVAGYDAASTAST